MSYAYYTCIVNQTPFKYSVLFEEVCENHFQCDRSVEKSICRLENSYMDPDAVTVVTR